MELLLCTAPLLLPHTGPLFRRPERKRPRSVKKNSRRSLKSPVKWDERQKKLRNCRIGAWLDEPFQKISGYQDNFPRKILFQALTNARAAGKIVFVPFSRLARMARFLCADLAHLVERLLPKQKVASSSLVIRSRERAEKP